MDRSTLIARFRLIAGGLALLAPRPAAALEKVINGRFDYGLGNWPQIVIGGDVSWDGTLDADGSALSGSLRFENDTGPPEPNRRREEVRERHPGAVIGILAETAGRVGRGRPAR